MQIRYSTLRILKADLNGWMAIFCMNLNLFLQADQITHSKVRFSPSKIPEFLNNVRTCMSWSKFWPGESGSSHYESNNLYVIIGPSRFTPVRSWQICAESKSIVATHTIMQSQASQHHAAFITPPIGRRKFKACGWQLTTPDEAWVDTGVGRHLKPSPCHLVTPSPGQNTPRGHNPGLISNVSVGRRSRSALRRDRHSRRRQTIPEPDGPF